MPKPWHPINHILNKVEAIQIVADSHVKGRSGGSFFLIPSDVEILVVRPTVGQTVDEPGVTVIGEDDRLIAGEEGVKLPI